MVVKSNLIKNKDLHILKHFCNRFNDHDFSEKQTVFKSIIPEDNSVNIIKGKVPETSPRHKGKERSRPDDIGGRILKNGPVQLLGIFCFITPPSQGSLSL